MKTSEAIASLKTLCNTCTMFPKCVNNKPECFQAIEMAISALEKQEQERWIPVTERLPEIGEYVLCQLPHAQSFGGGKIQVCKYCAPDKYRDKPYFDHFRDGFPNVLAWRPLPEPYTEDEA